MIRVSRFGFPRDSTDFHGPPPLQDALTEVLAKMEDHGHQIISASVLADPTSEERYEVYVVSRVVDEKAARGA